jgi:hypothetical protein
MTWILYLLSLPFAQDVKDLDSPKWRVRESAVRRLRESWPRCEAAILTKHVSDTPELSRLIDKAVGDYRLVAEWELMSFVAVVAGKDADNYDGEYWLSKPLAFFANIDQTMIGNALMPRPGGDRHLLVARSMYECHGSYYGVQDEQGAKKTTLDFVRLIYRGWQFDPQTGSLTAPEKS